MTTPRRVFVISDFRDERPQSVQLQQRMWVKGLTRLGLDVQRFSYRNVLMQLSRFRSLTLSLRFFKAKCDQVMASQIRAYRPDIVLILPMKYLNADSIRMAREAAPTAVFVSRDEDPYPDEKPERIDIARQTDLLIATFGGDWLRTYKHAGVRTCAFLPNLCDPDLQYRREVEARWRTDILFSGKLEHREHARSEERYRLIQAIDRMPNARLYQALGRPRIEGMDYFSAICGAKIALSINIYNGMRLYHSDRLINSVGCGTFTLTKQVPDSHLLFEDGVHLRYFNTPEEFFERAGFFLSHEAERDRVALAGMERAHQEFHCMRLSQCLLSLIDTGQCHAAWEEVL